MHEYRPDAAELPAALDAVRIEATRFLAGLATRRVRPTTADAAADAFGGPLPDVGVGAAAALRRLIEGADAAVVASAGPRFFHWVVGGATPAALGADWLTSVYDQVASSWPSSPLGVAVEQVALAWLQELFELPQHWCGVLTTGAHMANVTCLGAARQWWGERHGVDVARRGLAGLPTMPVLGGGSVHASIVKALAMLGHGRDAVRCFARDNAGRVDLARIEDALRALDGAPAVLIGCAGEVNAGHFDPLDDLADLAERYGAWLHVDGAFGLFARAAPSASHLASGVERADSVVADGHKWLNVPYDCGFAFVRERALLAKTFRMVADYLPPAADGETRRPVLSNLGPESSRRARGLAVWATLMAYGRAGVRSMVEGHLALARELAARVDAAPELERMAEVTLNIVCFRLHPEGYRKRDLDALNERLGAAILADGRVYVGTTRYRSVVCLRPSIVNWRTTLADIELLVDVVRELGDTLLNERRTGG